MTERYNDRPRSGSKAIAIDNRAQLAKIRFLLLMSLVSCGTLALVLQLIFGR